MPTQLSPHWTLEELACKCGCKGEQAPAIKTALARLVTTALEPLRVALGTSITATCGYRCPRHNAAVGGAPASEHTQGIAADLATADQIHLAVLASKIPGVGAIGLYPGKGIIHVDVRPRVAGRITTWEQVGAQYQHLRDGTRRSLEVAGAQGL